MPIYRKALPGDGDRVYTLICGLEERPLPRDRFAAIYRQQLADPHRILLVCEEDGQVIGILTLRWEDQLHHAARIAEAMEFAIDPAYRGHGIGREMFTRICQLAREAGCVQIELATNQLRTDAHRFYYREGMHNFHFKFSKPLVGEDAAENGIGR